MKTECPGRREQGLCSSEQGLIGSRYRAVLGKDLSYALQVCTGC